MKCYYEILEISREADDGEIKTAYRKLALKWHPDKNINNVEEAKEQFQLVQQAYEVLSDRQERAWYDKHREQILRGSNKDFKDDKLDVYEYFTTSCFRGYGDAENGFYTVYRKVFEDITKEDLEHMDSKSDYDEIPNFGNSQSNYDDVVGLFYAYWSSYTTKKSYVWLDRYNINEARNGRELKFIEKENKKIRQKAKKERNEEVRSLVAFVRKRDKRVQAHTKLLESKVAENRLKQEKLRKQKILENNKELTSHKSADWSKFDNVKDELKQIEKNLAEQFGEVLSDSESETETDLYCVACNKLFKNPKAFENHESSKKHLQNVEILKQSLLEEEEEISSARSTENNSVKSEKESDTNDLYCVICNKEFKTSKALANHESSKKHLENLQQESVIEEKDLEAEEGDEVEISEEGEDIEAKTTSKKKNKKSKKVIRLQKLSVTEDSEISGIENLGCKLMPSDDDNDFTTAKKSKKKKSEVKKNQKVNDKSLKEDVTFEENIENGHDSPETQNKKRIKKPQKKNIPTDVTDIDVTHCCVICQSNFPSKNKLFEHLKKTGHSVALPDKTVKSKNRIK